MLRIRPSEKRGLEGAAREEFVEHMLDILRDAWSAEVAKRTEDGVKELLRAWMTVLSEGGVLTETPLAKALNVFFSVLVDFDEDPAIAPWIRTILTDASGTELSKAASLEGQLFRRYADRKG